MDDKRLTEIVQVRVTRQMKRSLNHEAQRLGLREVDVVRLSLAWILFAQDSQSTLDAVYRSTMKNR